MSIEQLPLDTQGLIFRNLSCTEKAKLCSTNKTLGKFCVDTAQTKFYKSYNRMFWDCKWKQAVLAKEFEPLSLLLSEVNDIPLGTSLIEDALSILGLPDKNPVSLLPLELG